MLRKLKQNFSNYFLRRRTQNQLDENIEYLERHDDSNLLSETRNLKKLDLSLGAVFPATIEIASGLGALAARQPEIVYMGLVAGETLRFVNYIFSEDLVHQNTREVNASREELIKRRTVGYPI